MNSIEALVRPNIRTLSPYSTARDEAKGTPDIFLDANESPYPGLGYNRYPDPRQKVLKARVSALKGLPVENIFIGNGSDEAIDLCYRVFCTPGKDNAVIIAPSYGMYSVCADINDIESRQVPLNEDFSLPVERLLAATDERTKLMWICSPNNPTGNVHTKEYIEHLLNEYPDTLFLVDEAYYEFAGITCKDLVRSYDNLLISRTMSKAFALANFRLGYLIASKDNIQFINKIRNPKNLSTLAQEAACAALSDVDYMWRYVEEVKRGKEYFMEASKQYFDKYIVHPSYGNFLLLEFKTHADKMALLTYLADHNIFARDTTQAPMVYNCFRITIGTMEQMRQVISIIDSFYSK